MCRVVLPCVVNVLCLLRTQVSSYPPADSFKWAFNNSAEFRDVPSDKYSMRGALGQAHAHGRGRGAHLSASTLTYTPASDLDYGTVICWASNRAGSQDQPCVFHLVAAGRHPHTHHAPSTRIQAP